jgi:hypothetical protein
MRTRLAVLASLATLAFSLAAQADTISSFDVNFVRNATNGPSSDLGTLGTSNPLSVTFGGFNCTANLSLTGSQITVALTSSCSVNPQNFGGLTFTDLTPSTSIGSAALDAASTLTSPVVTSTSSEILLNLQGDVWASGNNVILDFSPPAVSATPEPSSIALLSTGLLSMAGVVRKRLRKA